MYFLIKDFGDEDLVGIRVRNLRQVNKHIESCEKENIKYYILKETTLADVTVVLTEEGKT